MSLKINQKPRVSRDFEAHADFIARDKLDPAIRLLRVAKDSFDLLAEHPSLGLPWKSPRRHLAGIRFYPMPAPYRSYLIFYRVDEKSESIDFLAVLHGARNLETVLRDSADRDFEE